MIRNGFRNRKGLSALETIGAMTAITVIAFLMLPKIQETIAHASAARIAMESNTYTAALVKWYQDVGALHSMDKFGDEKSYDDHFEKALLAIPCEDFIEGLCANWKGPYIKDDSLRKPIIGKSARLVSTNGASGVDAGTFDQWDLTGKNTGSLDDTNQVVALVIDKVPQKDAMNVDGIMDQGLSDKKNQSPWYVGGRVKWKNNRLIILIAKL